MSAARLPLPRAATRAACIYLHAHVPPPFPPSSRRSDGYMFFHHTTADTVDKMDPQQKQTVAAANAIWALSIANLPTLLPRD